MELIDANLSRKLSICFQFESWTRIACIKTKVGGHQHLPPQSTKIMTIKIESVINQWDSETDEVIIRFLNLLTLAKTRRELEQALDFSPFKEQFRKHLLWGWGSRHLWVKQRCPYNGSVAENRLLIVEF